MKIRALLLIVILILASDADAFDGKRKGFVLGGGIGFAPISQFSGSLPKTTKSQGALSFSIFVGHGASESNLFGIIADGNYYNVPNSSSLTVTGWILGAAWLHYFCNKASSPYVSLSAGRYAQNVFLDERSNPPYIVNVDSYWNSAGSGFGVDLGVGYQINKLLQCSFKLIFARTSGRTRGPYPVDVSTNHVVVGVSLAATVF